MGAASSRVAGACNCEVLYDQVVLHLGRHRAAVIILYALLRLAFAQWTRDMRLFASEQVKLLLLIVRWVCCGSISVAVDVVYVVLRFILATVGVRVVELDLF